MKRLIWLVMLVPTMVFGASGLGPGGPLLSPPTPTAGGGGTATNIVINTLPGLINTVTNSPGNFSQTFNTNAFLSTSNAYFGHYIGDGDGVTNIGTQSLFRRTSATKMATPTGLLDTTGSTTDGIQEALNQVKGTTTKQVFLAPGIYTNSTSITVPTNCSLIAEPGSVLIVNMVTNAATANFGRAIVPCDNSVISGITVTNFWKDGFFQSCFGLNDKAGDKCATNWFIINCRGFGDSDDLHFSHSNAVQGTIIGGVFESKYDAFAVGGGSGHSYTTFGTTIRCIGPSLQTPGNVSSALNNTGSNTFILHDTTLYASNNGTAYPINNTGGNLIMYGGSFWGKPTQLNDVNHDAASRFNVFGTMYDFTKYNIPGADNSTPFPRVRSFPATNIYTPVDAVDGIVLYPFSIYTGGNDGSYRVSTFSGLGDLTIENNYSGAGVYLNSGVIGSERLRVNGTSSFEGIITNRALTVSQLVGTDNTKALTSIAVGSGLTLSANTLSASIPPNGIQAQRIVSDVTKATTNSMASLTDWTFNITTGNAYVFRAVMIMTNDCVQGDINGADYVYLDFNGGVGGTVSDLMVTITGGRQNGTPSDATFLFTSGADAHTLTALVPNPDVTPTPDFKYGLANGGTVVYELNGTIVCNGTGTFIPRWNFVCSGSATPVNIRLKKGSYMTLTQTGN